MHAQLRVEPPVASSFVEQFGFRTLCSIGDGVIATDTASRVIFLNPAGEQLTGWTADDAIGRHFDEVFRIVHADDPTSAVESPVARVLRDRQVLKLDGAPLLVRRDGSAVPIADSAAPLHLESGTIEGVVLVFRDASSTHGEVHRQTLLARASAELGSSFDVELTLQRLAELLAAELTERCAIDVFERSGATRQIADARRRVFASPAREPQVFRATLYRRGQPWGQLVADLRSAEREEQELDRSTLAAIAERASAAIDNAHLYREAQLLRAEAEAASHAKDEFLAMLGHELRNPLAPIVTAAELMRRRGGTDCDRELGIVERQLRHVVRLVDDLLDVSRVVHGRIQLRFERVDVRESILAAVERVQPLIEEKRHDLRVECRAGLVLRGDAYRLTQAVGNVLVNAAKYTPPGGRIHLQAEEHDQRVAIRVRDSGIGIAPEMLSRVFELFVQDRRSLDRSQGGLGVGLAVVRAVVLAHHGKVWATSDGLGRGTEFVIELPALCGATTGDGDAPGRSAPSARRVLVVDDNVDAADLLAASLSLLGYEAFKAYDPETALALAERMEPSAALLDIGLPQIDGYELARRLRAIDGVATMKLIAITGYGQPRDRERSRAAGFDAHLVKPVAMDVVARILACGGQDG